jgi:hypothetical protein
MKRVLVLVSMFALTGCGMGGCGGASTADLPSTPGELREVAEKCRDDAKAARAEKKADQAAAHATRAEAAAEKAAALVKAAELASGAGRKEADEAKAAAKAARRIANLADEERKRDDLVTGWKGIAYKRGRELAFPAACNGLALAADQAAKADVETLPEAVRQSAELAADLAKQHAGRKPLANGHPDWPMIAADLRAVGEAPPPAILAEGLAFAFILARKKEFALYEIETVDPDAAKRNRNEETGYRLLRGYIYSANGLQLLAAEEVNKAPLIDAKDNPEYGPQILAGMHLAVAAIHIDNKDYEEADRAIVRAMRAWPNNPVSVFLTGEQQAASGEYEKAAQSLEQAAKGTKNEWLAEKIARRARDLRDNPGKGETLLHDHAFIAELLLDYLAIAAKESETARVLQQYVVSARELSQKVLAQFPGGQP